MSLGRSACVALMALLITGAGTATTTVPTTGHQSFLATGTEIGQLNAGQAVVGRPGAAPTTLRVHLAQITPTVAVTNRPVTLTVRVTNPTPTAVRGVVVRIRRGDRAVRARTEIQRWDAEGVVPGRLLTLVERPIPGSLSPGSTAAVAVTLPPTPLPGDPYGAAPLEIEAVRGDHTARRRTFLPYFRVKEYTPLDMAFVAPLTADANPALYSTSATERFAAWGRLLGPSGRLSRILDGTTAAPVTMLVDPAILGAADASAEEPNPPDGGSAKPTPTNLAPTSPPTAATNQPGHRASTAARTTSAATDSATSAGPQQTPDPQPTPNTPAGVSTPTTDASETDEVARLQGALSTRLRAERTRHGLWLLPTGDPDLSALTAHQHTDALRRRLLAPAVVPASPEMPRVAWPAGPHADESARTAIAAAFGSTPPAMFLSPIGPLDQFRASQASAPHRDGGGRLVLGYDEELSRLWGALAARETAVETTQRFLAESAALLAQSPSRRRSVLVVSPRLFDADPAAQQAFFQAVRDTPWVNTVPAENLRTSAAAATNPTSDSAGPGHTPSATPTHAPGGSPVPDVSAPEVAGATTTVPPSPLTGSDAGLIENQQRDLRGIRSILTEPDPAVRTLQRGADSLAATVWRYDPAAWKRLRAAQTAAVQRYTNGVSVRPSTVNFFADSGVLQVTVVNDLDRDVRGLALTLNPEGRASRLRILRQPDFVQIRRNSRTTVRATVEAIAAGAVPVSTRLTTPEGTTLGKDATVRVTVQPTNGWAVLALGGLAGVVFLAGLYRTLRGGKPRMTHEELNRIDLT